MPFAYANFGRRLGMLCVLEKCKAFPYIICSAFIHICRNWIAIYRQPPRFYGYHAVEVAIYVVSFFVCVRRLAVCTLRSLQMASGRASIAGASLFLIERYCRAICDDFHVSALQKLLRNNVSELRKLCCSIGSAGADRFYCYWKCCCNGGMSLCVKTCTMYACALYTCNA